MADFNRVILMGNLTKDPEVRYIPSGTAVGDLSLAINRRYKSSDGQDQEETCFVDITVWGRQAETCGEYLRKGRPVLVEGRLKQDRWEKDGKKFSRLVVVADRVQFLGSAPAGNEFRDTPASGSLDQRETPRAAPPAEEPPPPDSAEDEDNLPF